MFCPKQGNRENNFFCSSPSNIFDIALYNVELLSVIENFVCATDNTKLKLDMMHFGVLSGKNNHIVSSCLAHKRSSLLTKFQFYEH